MFSFQVRWYETDTVMDVSLLLEFWTVDIVIVIVNSINEVHPRIHTKTQPTNTIDINKSLPGYCRLFRECCDILLTVAKILLTNVRVNENKRNRGTCSKTFTLTFTYLIDNIMIRMLIRPSIYQTLINYKNISHINAKIFNILPRIAISSQQGYKN